MSIIKFISSNFSISSSYNKKQNHTNNNIGTINQYSNDRVSCIGGGVLGFKSNFGIDGSFFTTSGRCGDGYTYGRNYY